MTDESADRPDEGEPEAHEKEYLILLRQGRKIEAIKLYREHNPTEGLKESKDVIFALAKREGLQHRAREGGCGTAALAILISLGAAIGGAGWLALNLL